MLKNRTDVAILTDFFSRDQLFPYLYQKDGDLRSLSLKSGASCPRCETSIQDIRGTAQEWFCGEVVQSIDFDAHGFCHKCRCLVPLRIRIYPEQDRLIWFDGEGWQEARRSSPGVFGHLSDLFKRVRFW